MLNNLSEQIRECLEHAEDCAREAAAQPKGSPSKQDYLNLEKRWLGLARRFKKSDRVTFGCDEGIWVISPPAASRRPDPSIIRLARDDNVLPASRRRCLFVRAGLMRTGFAEARDY
jgi:hypothetical protein